LGSSGKMGRCLDATALSAEPSSLGMTLTPKDELWTLQLDIQTQRNKTSRILFFSWCVLLAAWNQLCYRRNFKKQ
jgi:hypothetical protein